MSALPSRARIEEMCETWAANAADAQRIKTLKAALESAQSDRARLEDEVAFLTKQNNQFVDRLELKDEAIALLRDALAERENV